jgi:hypothetical protein
MQMMKNWGSSTTDDEGGRGGGGGWTPDESYGPEDKKY